MPPELSIVKVDKRKYRTIARENWGLTKEQMVGRHVHHRIPVSEGGTNDPSNLYVCTGLYHDIVWHGEDGGFIALAAEGGKKSKELGAGAHAPGKQSKGGKIGGKIGGKKAAELGLGAHAPGKRSEGGKKAAELGLGIHAPGKQSKGGKTTAAQKWQNTDPRFPPFISSSGCLSQWQKARGIDTSMRVKLAG